MQQIRDALNNSDIGAAINNSRLGLYVKSKSDELLRQRQYRSIVEQAGLLGKGCRLRVEYQDQRNEIWNLSGGVNRSDLYLYRTEIGADRKPFSYGFFIDDFFKANPSPMKFQFEL